MDTLKPRIIHIGGRCYRANPVDPLPGWSEEDYESQDYNDQMYSCNIDGSDGPSCDLDITETEKGFQLKVDVPSAFFGYICGNKGETKKKIEKETQTQIMIPQMGKEVEEITLLAAQKKNLISAKTRLEVLSDTARRKQNFTHFLSFPVNSQTIKNGFLDFKEDILRELDGTPGVDEKIFQVPAKLHMTITTLVLMNRKEVTKARELLERCKQEVIDPLLDGQPLVIDMRGLEYMNDDPSQVNVLYGKVQLKDNSNKLQIIADELMQRFRAAGLGKIDYDRVKLHTTLLNAAFRRNQEGDEGPDRQYNLFDIRPIMQNFGNFFFGEHHINEVHISQKGSYGQDGFYLPAGLIRLP